MYRSGRVGRRILEIKGNVSLDRSKGASVVTVYVESEKKLYTLTELDTTVLSNWKEVGSGGSSDPIDTAMSLWSTNAVQNRAITEYIDGRVQLDEYRVPSTVKMEEKALPFTIPLNEFESLGFSWTKDAEMYITSWATTEGTYNPLASEWWNYGTLNRTYEGTNKYLFRLGKYMTAGVFAYFLAEKDEANSTVTVREPTSEELGDFYTRVKKLEVWNQERATYTTYTACRTFDLARLKNKVDSISPVPTIETAGNWTYRRYADGTFEAWYRIDNQSFGITAQSGNFYRTEPTVLELPAAIGCTQIKWAKVECFHSGYPVMTSLESVSTSFFKWYAVSGGSRNYTSGYIVMAHVIGTWE